MTHDAMGTAAVETLAELKALNARFIHNFITNDVPSHDAILHPRFLAIQSNGARMDRLAYLKRWASGFHPDVIPYWDVRDEVITVIGDLALVHSTNKHEIVRDGRTVTGMTAYTDTYLRENGKWLCIQAQLTPVQPEAEPDDETIVSIYLKGVKQSAKA